MSGPSEVTLPGRADRPEDHEVIEVFADVACPGA
jgi:hypothetical protein